MTLLRSPVGAAGPGEPDVRRSSGNMADDLFGVGRGQHDIQAGRPGGRPRGDASPSRWQLPGDGRAGADLSGQRRDPGVRARRDLQQPDRLLRDHGALSAVKVEPREVRERRHPLTYKAGLYRPKHEPATDGRLPMRA